MPRASVYRQRQPQPGQRRRGPVRPLPDPELTAEIRAVLAASPFHCEGHRKVWARLRVRGIRTSLRRVLRLMREHALLAPSRMDPPRGPRNHDGTIIPETIDTLWGTDMTTAWTSGNCCINLGGVTRGGHLRSRPVASVQAPPLSG